MAGDVGGASEEEIDIFQPGGNYGLPLYEGYGFKRDTWSRAASSATSMRWRA